MELTTLSKNLVFLRKNKGWKQSEIEDRCGIKQRNWSNWENAVSEPSATALIFIADMFGVTIDTLLKENISKNTSLIDKTTIAIYAKKHIPKNIPNSIPNEVSMAAEEEIPIIRKGIESMLYEQLNKLTNEVIKIRKKLEE